MKKVMILAVVAALIGISAPSFAQVPGSSQPSSTQEPVTTPDDKTQQQPGTVEQGTQGSQGTGSQGTKGTGVSTGSESMSSNYTEEVKATDLPAAITRSLNEIYPGYKTEKAFRGIDGTYKVKVSKGEEKQTLFFDERGEAVKMQK